MHSFQMCFVTGESCCIWEKGGGRGVLGKPPLPQSPLPMLCWIYPIYGKREGEGVRGWILSDVCSVNRPASDEGLRQNLTRKKTEMDLSSGGETTHEPYDEPSTDYI